MDFEKMKKEKEAMDIIIDMMANTGISKFKILKNRNSLFNKISDLISSDDVLEGSEELAEKVLSLIEQFENIIDDFIKENNITIED